MTAAPSLEAGLAELGRTGVLQLPQDAATKLHSYLALLQKWNQVYNLTAVREAHRMVTHHLLDSLAVLPYLDQRPVSRVLDIGSGAGLPGIPLAIARPQWQFTLLDSSHKRTAFLQQALAELELVNAHVVTSRVETYTPAELHSVVISRAFADLATFAEAGARLLASGGRLVAMKGVFPHEEMEQVPGTLRIVDAPAVAVPGLSAQRHLVILEAA